MQHNNFKNDINLLAEAYKGVLRPPTEDQEEVIDVGEADENLEEAVDYKFRGKSKKKFKKIVKSLEGA